MIKFKKTIASVGIVTSLFVGSVVVDNLPNKELSEVKLAEKYNASVKIKEEYKINETSLIKHDIKNSKLDKYKNEPKDEIEVSIGENNAGGLEGLVGTITGKKEFHPNIEMKRWNEVSFKLKTERLLKNKKNKAVSFLGKKVKFTTDKMDFEMYAPDDESYKYIWYLNQKPTTNKVEFEIESSGLDFFYQPALNEEYPQSKNCSPTQCDTDADGDLDSFRPENVVGSYAVYHSTKDGVNDKNAKEYKTGKAFHIFRPHIIDANGTETWGILHIENGIYSVEIPQDFLDSAVYPIKSNDTFGYTSVGASSLNFISNELVGTLVSAPASESIDSISIYGTLGTASAFSFKATMVLDSNHNILTNGVGGTASFEATPGWKTATYSTKPSVSSGTNYDISGVISVTNSNDDNYLFYDSSGDNTLYDFSNSYTTPTNPTDGDHTTLSAIIFSIYATYTPSGGATRRMFISQ